MNRDQAIEYIHSVSWRGSVPGLGRIRELCRLLGDPQKELRFVHVAGTNGKGSVCSMLSSVLTAAGYRVGLFTSPFVRFFEERISVSGEPIPGDALGRVTERVREAAEKMRDVPTEFELLTAVGFEYFRERRCDIVVLEVGLGGRLDSTNVIPPPVLSIITGIGLDHTAILGDTLGAVAREKAGIIKPGSPVVIGDLPPEAEEAVTDAARRAGAPVVKADRARIESEVLTPSGASLCDRAFGQLSISLAGRHQLSNASVVLTAAEILAEKGFRISEQSVRDGLAAARWPARFETLSRDPLVIYDGAHNPDGIRALTENVNELLGGRAILVMGVMADKDYRSMVSSLRPVAARVFTVRPDNPRSLDPSVTSALFEEKGVPAAAAETVEEGISLAVKEGEKTGLPVLVMGTLYMYCEAEPIVKKLTRKAEIL